MPGPKNDKILTDALRLVANEPVPRDPENFKKVRRLASKVWDAALDLEPWAVTFLADRLEGKPHQSSSVDADVKTTVTEIAIRGVKPGGGGS